jgi:hypothetical protein
MEFNPMDAKRDPFHLLRNLALGLLILALSGCSALFPRIPTPISQASIHTAAAKTVMAHATLSAGQTAVAQLTQMAGSGGIPSQASPTALPVTEIPTLMPPTATLAPTATLIPPTPVPPTPVPPTRVPPTPVPPPCDWAQFVTDVTVPDGTAFNPGAPFTKVWRIRNIGSCTWNASYSLVFVSGDRMQTRNVFPVPGVVYPGQVVDLSADFIAPSTPGRYRSNWMLSNPSGRTFGIGPAANRPFWVDIIVKNIPGPYPYDFVANMCAAAWHNGSRALPCPGNPASELGSIVMLPAPRLETGKHENEPALWTRPEATRGGQISGVYPAYRVQSGDRFMADIGCLENSPQCDVTFILDYQVAGQPVRNLGSWREVSDNQLRRLDIDLAGLVGQSVQFILRVVNNGRPADANAFWLVPSIRRSGTVPPSPTPDWESLPAVQAARVRLGIALGINPARFNLRGVEAVQWPDTCLGIPQPGIVCAPVIVPGYRIILGYSGQRYEVHTDQLGDIIYWFPL